MKKLSKKENFSYYYKKLKHCLLWTIYLFFKTEESSSYLQKKIFKWYYYVSFWKLYLNKTQFVYGVDLSYRINMNNGFLRLSAFRSKQILQSLFFHAVANYKYSLIDRAIKIEYYVKLYIKERARNIVTYVLQIFM